MSLKYQLYFELIEVLSRQNDLIATPRLYDYDPEKIYTNTLDRLAQPLPDNSESPFSSRNPFSTEGILVGQILNLLYYSVWREANLIPENLLLSWLRILGLGITAPTSPVIELEFIRTPASIASGIPARIPLGLEIRSRFNSDLVAIVQEELLVEETKALCSAKLNLIGLLSDTIRSGEFSLLPLQLADFSSVRNTRVLSPGTAAKTAQNLVSEGVDLLRNPGSRIITARDYVEAAVAAGAAKATLLPNMVVGETKVSFSDAMSLVVYPQTVKELVRAQISDRLPAGVNLQVAAAKVIPIDGKISVRFDPSIDRTVAFDLLATRIVEAINPPHGNFGELDLNLALAVALEEVRGILAVPELALKHSVTGLPLSELEVLPHYLFEIQSSIEINYL